MPDEVIVDIAQWVDRARADPAKHLERLATEIVVTAVGLSPGLRNDVFLKGGVLMGIAYGSPRQTADLDYTTTLEPAQDVAERIAGELNAHFPVAAAELGSPDIVCRVQSWEHKPRKAGFAGHDFPALIAKVAYARRDGPTFRYLETGQCPDVVGLDLSFREPLFEPMVLRLAPSGNAIGAYSLAEMIAEKIRAFLQQEIRDRSRRQDIYDVALLIGRFHFDSAERATLLDVLQKKCAARGIFPSVEGIDDPILIGRAKSEWNSMKLETGDLPDFDSCHTAVRAFYRSLPW